MRRDRGYRGIGPMKPLGPPSLSGGEANVAAPAWHTAPIALQRCQPPGELPIMERVVERKPPMVAGWPVRTVEWQRHGIPPESWSRRI